MDLVGFETSFFHYAMMVPWVRLTWPPCPLSPCLGLAFLVVECLASLDFAVLGFELFLDFGMVFFEFIFFEFLSCGGPLRLRGGERVCPGQSWFRHAEGTDFVNASLMMD